LLNIFAVAIYVEGISPKDVKEASKKKNWLGKIRDHILLNILQKFSERRLKMGGRK
jgi:hypothetical protein